MTFVEPWEQRLPKLPSVAAAADPWERISVPQVDARPQADPWEGRPEGRSIDKSADPGMFDYGVEIGKSFLRGGAGTGASVLRGAGANLAQSEATAELESAIAAAQGGQDPAQAAKTGRERPVPLRSVAEQGVYQAGEEVEAATSRALPDRNILHPLVRDVSAGFGSLGANIAIGLASGPAAVLSSILQGQGEAAERAVKAKATPGQERQAAGLGSIAGATELADNLLPMVGGSTGKALGLLKKFGIGAIIEGIQEGGQQFIQNWIEQGIYNPERDKMDDVPYNALVGVIVGGTAKTILPSPRTGQKEPGQEQLEGVTTQGDPWDDRSALGLGEPWEVPPAPSTLVQAPTALGSPAPRPGAATVMDLQRQQLLEPGPTFYSRVLQAAEEKLPNMGSPDQMLASIRNATGVKVEELEEIGLPAFFGSQRGPVSKKDVIEFIEGNQVRVEEGEEFGYGEYTLPGPRSGYRILTLRMPNKPLPTGSLGLPVEDPNFYGGHLEENTLAYAMVSERMDETGKKYLFAENIQSDWMQQGVKKGFRDLNKIKELATKYRQLKVAREGISKSMNLEWKFLDFIADMLSEIRQADEQDTPRYQELVSIFERANSESGFRKSEELNNRIQSILRELQNESRRVPSAPFKSTWSELTLKRLIRYAADKGFTRIAFTNGDLAAKFNTGGNVSAEQISGLRYFYDKALPSVIKRWAKKLGGTIGEMWIPDAVIDTANLIAQRRADPNDPGADDFVVVNRVTGQEYGSYDSRVDAQRALMGMMGKTLLGPPKVMFMEIPETAKTFIQQGLPLFKKQQVVPIKERLDVRIEGDGSLDVTHPMVNEAAKVIQAFEEFTKKFSWHGRLKLVISNTVKGHPDVSGLHTYYPATGLSVINIPLSKFRDTASLWATMMHEFGHAVMHQEFSQLSDAAKMVIRAEYDAWLAEQAKAGRTLGQIDDTRQSHVFGLTASLSRYDQDLQSEYSAQFASSVSPQTYQYVTSFSEWFADQVAKWATTPGPALTLFEKSVAKIANAIRTMFEIMTRKQGIDFRPSFHMNNWLNSILEPGRVPLTLAEYKALDLRTMIENQDALSASEPGLVAAEQQPETGFLRQVISRLMGGGFVPPNGPVGRGTMGPGTGPTGGGAIAQMPAMADKMNKFYKVMVHLFQLTELNPRLDGLQRYAETMRIANTEEAKITDAALRIVKDWDNLRQQGENLTLLIDDVTNMVYRTPQEVAQGIQRHPTQAELQALIRIHRVSADALRVFNDIRRVFNVFLDLSSQLARDEALKITDPVARAAAINAINANVAGLRSKPYFPFMRNGRHVVIVRNAAGVTVHREHFERRGLVSAERQQKEAIKQMTAAFGPDFTVTPDILPPSSGPLIGMPKTMLDAIAAKLQLTPAQSKAMEQLRFELAPAQSFRHRFQNKRYTKGYSRDFRRSFAQYFFHGARWYVKVKYKDILEQNILDVRQSIGQTSTPLKRLEIANFMTDHLHKNFLDPSLDFITLKAAAVFWTLGFVPVSAAVNLSQVPMVSLPFLGGKFGDIRASKELVTAIFNTQNFWKKKSYKGLTQPDMIALDYAIQTGRLDQTLAAELASWSQNSNLGTGYGGGTGARAMHELLQKAMWMFEIAEKANRRITFMATLNLARKDPNNTWGRQVLGQYTDELTRMMASGIPASEARAIIIASHVVDQTQFMATQESRPKFMRGKWGTLFLFKRFIQGVLFANLNNKRDVLPRSILVMLLMAGLGGLPGYEDLKEITRLLGWWIYGRDWSVERELRKLVRSMTDESWAPDLLLHGTSRMAFGLPALLNALGSTVGMQKFMPTQDLSRSLSIGPILPIQVGAAFGPPVKDAPSRFAEQSARAGGVVGGLAFNFYKALGSRDDASDFKRWEMAMPRFARNMSHSYRAFSEQKERGKTQVPIITYDTRDPEHLGEIIGLAGGFQPRRLTAQWDYLRDKAEVTGFVDMQRGMLLAQWGEAIRRGDSTELETVRAATVRFNDELPDFLTAKRLTAKTIETSVKTRIRTQAMQAAGNEPIRANQPIADEMRRLHPEANVIDAQRVR